MNWERYKARCDEPRVISRWLLEHTAALLEESPGGASGATPALAATLRAAANQRPLPKPADHKGGAQTDMFQTPLPLTAAKAVLAAMQRLAATPSALPLKAATAAWAEYCAAAADAAER